MGAGCNIQGGISAVAPPPATASASFAGRILSRRQAPAALSRWVPAGARARLLHGMMKLHSKRNLGGVAATAGHRLGFFRRNHELNAAMIIAIFTAVGCLIWCMSENRTEREHVVNEIPMACP